MLGGKKDDLAALARFLDHEAERWERIRLAREAVSRIQSLTQAEADARSALEAAEADLAWAKIQIVRLETLLPQAKEALRRELKSYHDKISHSLQSERLLRAEENRRLDAQLAEKRALLERFTRQIEEVQAFLSGTPP
jgi:DNA repair exonuclease SbcCD ATPase subunit